jgi:hypothetical protein
MDTDRDAAGVGLEENDAPVVEDAEKETVAGTLVPGLTPSDAEHAANIEHATRIFDVLMR